MQAVQERQKLFYLILAGLLLLAALAGSLSWTWERAAASQLDAPQVTLNPGGGIEEDGSDGIRFTINSDFNGNWPTTDYAGAVGQDGVVYRGTFQYCCTGGGPMLNIGGQLYGQAGPVGWGSDYGLFWDSIEIMATSGTAAVGERTGATGNAAATVRYRIEHGGLTYTIDRTVTYVYPNDYVADTYTFNIPEGNTDTVKFYLGGDTAPGSSDQGYGIMLTEPVRSVISLNTSSEIMFGFREVPDGRAFDGATSQSYSAPYDTVRDGGNIGFVGSAFSHDAGLMVQWNLGSNPGTQTAGLQQFVTAQGTNLNAAFGAEKTEMNQPVALNISIVNTVLSEADELGYTLTLPAGLVIGSGSKSNSCGGSLTAAAGTSTITLSGGAAASATNCVVSVPVVSAVSGAYTISAASISGLEGLNNNVGTSSLTVLGPIEEADKNGDSVRDDEQGNVAVTTSSVTGKVVVLEVDDASCSADDALVKAETTHAVEDPGYDYPEGLLNFTVSCGSGTVTIKQYYYGVDPAGFVLRKFNPVTNAYFTISGATIATQTIYGQPVLTVTYDITDGGPLDIDGSVNGIIVDPAGLGINMVGAPNTGLGGRPTGFVLGRLVIIN